LQKRLAGETTPSGFAFADLVATAPQVYPQLQAEIDQLNKRLEEQDLKLPEKLLPPLDKITAELAPSAQVSWADEAGFHMKGISPFPGSDLLSAGPAGGVSGLAELIARTSKDVARIAGPVKSGKSADNMRAIGQQLLIYAAKNNGKFPPELATLVAQKLVKPEVLINPSSGVSLPANFATMSADDQSEWFSEHPCYVYGGANLDMTTVADTTTKAILREKDGEGADGKVNVLFVDGHVAAQPEADAKAAVGK
jgi:prepilin-type processing-associated H-X9-DG protein